MPSSKFWSLGGTGLVTCGAWRSIEASTAPLAMRCSRCGGATFALVGRKPSMAMPRPPRMRTRRVTITPRMNLPMKPPLEVTNCDLKDQSSYCGRWSGWGASFEAAEKGTSAGMAATSLRSAERAPRPSRVVYPSPSLIRLQLTGFADYVAHLRQVVLFLRGREWDGGI